MTDPLPTSSQEPPMIYFWVAPRGARIGSMARLLLGVQVHNVDRAGGFPWGTILVNIHRLRWSSGLSRHLNRPETGRVIVPVNCHRPL